ncbi:hypothetical protein MKW92_014003, partial [Papaver armeniacum]
MATQRGARTLSQILTQSKNVSILSSSESTSSRFVTTRNLSSKSEGGGSLIEGFVELIGKLANPLSEDETLSLNTSRGWPFTSFFIDGKP